MRQYLANYIIIALTNMYALHIGNTLLAAITKPLLMISLAIYAWKNFNKKSELRKFTLLSLLFAWGGDVFLMLAKNPIYFLSGIASFSFCHMLYIYIFWRNSRAEKKKSAPRFYSVVYFLMFCYGVAFTYYLWPYTGEFRIPIICYSLIIIAMLSLASYRYEYVSRKSFLACFLGAIFFVLSDSLIAYNGFVTTLAHGRVAIMFFYTLAQLLLVQGIIISENKD